MRENFGMLADVDLWMRLCARWKVGYIAEPLIEVRQERPQEYPDPYSYWSWDRLRLLYEIHATNRREYYGKDGLHDKVRWFSFRCRVNLNITYWLVYAVAKGRWRMLQTSQAIANKAEFFMVEWLRKVLARATRGL